MPQGFGEAAEEQLHAALRAALAAAGELVCAWPAQRTPLLYAGVLLLDAAPHGALEAIQQSMLLNLPQWKVLPEALSRGPVCW